MNKKRIEIYNKLTNINGIPDNNNFLMSIEYKPEKGNILLDFLYNLEYDFEILEGFINKEILVDPIKNKFMSCMIKTSNNIENIQCDKLNIEKISDNIYLITIEGDI